MRKIIFTIELEFADKITSDQDLQQVAENVAEAVKHAANTCGVAPEGSDTYLQKVIVSSDVLGVEASRNVE